MLTTRSNPRVLTVPSGVTRRWMYRSLPIAAACAAPAARAHDGHGLPGAHWHASDVWGFVVMAALVGLAWWIGRK